MGWLNDTNQPTLPLPTDASYADIKEGKQSSVGHVLYLGRDTTSYYASATKKLFDQRVSQSYPNKKASLTF